MPSSVGSTAFFDHAKSASLIDRTYITDVQQTRLQPQSEIHLDPYLVTKLQVRLVNELPRVFLEFICRQEGRQALHRNDGFDNVRGHLAELQKSFQMMTGFA